MKKNNPLHIYEYFKSVFDKYLFKISYYCATVSEHMWFSINIYLKESWISSNVLPLVSGTQIAAKTTVNAATTVYIKNVPVENITLVLH